MSTTQRKPARKPQPEFTLVYDSKAPKSLHADTATPCWKGHMRPATAEELEKLKDAPRCRHCVTRLARLEAQAKAETEKKAAEAKKPIARKEAAQQHSAEAEKVAA